MENRVQVSISGIAFVFDNEAYDLMRNYIDRLKATYANDPDGREIITDIEARIAELLLDTQESDKIVEQSLAKSIVAQLGYPEEAGGSGAAPAEKFPRRLYRDPEGAKIAGICSGLGTYFNVDPVWIRVGLFLPLLLMIVCGGLRLTGLTAFFALLIPVFFILYFVLWVAVPMARTPRQRLEMRGEKITADKIERSFREDAKAVGSGPRKEKSASVWAQIVYIAGQVILFFVKFVIAVVGFALLIAAMSIVVMIVGAAVGEVSGAIIPDIPDLRGMSSKAYAIMLLVSAFIPLMVLGWLMLKILLRSRGGGRFLMIMGGAWLLLVVFLAAIAFRNIDSFKAVPERIKTECNTRHKASEPNQDSYWEDNWLFDEHGKAHPKHQ